MILDNSQTDCTSLDTLLMTIMMIAVTDEDKNHDDKGTTLFLIFLYLKLIKKLHKARKSQQILILQQKT